MATATFQRFRWLLFVVVLLSSIGIVFSLGNGVQGRHIPFVDKKDVSAASVPLRILTVGDSITEGNWANGNNGYRLELRNQLVQQGHPVDFVGTNTLGDNNTDNQHEGWGGQVLSVIQEKIMADGILTTHPNLVLLLAGTNDNNEAFGLPPVEPHATQILRLENLMNAIFCEVPETTLIVAQIPNNLFGPDNTMRVQQYNSEIPVLVAKKRAQGLKVWVVDQYHAVGDSLDEGGIHPTSEGYTKMAHAWFEAIDSVPADWIKPPRAPQSRVPRSWYRQQRTACDALKGWDRDTYVTNMTFMEERWPLHMDMTNWTRLHDL